MSKYTVTIGLEIHIKLNTQHKIFCSCANSQDFDHTQPNTHICPTCTAQPGALPVVDPECIHKAIKLATILGCKVQNHFVRDRKSYFYPDIPTGYQITQYARPIMVDGQLTYRDSDFGTQNSVRIHEAHLENDTAKSIHYMQDTLLDFNRAGTPLVEIVTEPDFHDIEQVTDFLKTLQKTIKRNDIGYADLEKGQMRIDVNISISDDPDRLGTRVEIKNMNSLSAIRKAISYEVDRQTQILESGGSIDQSTVTWDDMDSKTMLMRSKEDAMDYRYFPEPDIPAIHISALDQIMNQYQKTDIYADGYIYDISYIIGCLAESGLHKEYIYGMTGELDIYDYYVYICRHTDISPKTICKWMMGSMMKYINENLSDSTYIPSENLGLAFSREDFVNFIDMQDKLTDRDAKVVLEKMLETGQKAEDIYTSLGLDKSVDIDISALCDQAISAHPQVVQQYRDGKVSSIQFLLGQVMRSSGGAAAPQDILHILKNKLG